MGVSINGEVHSGCYPCGEPLQGTPENQDCLCRQGSRVRSGDEEIEDSIRSLATASSSEQLLAERNNHFIMTTTATCLLVAGLPPCFWNHAVECVSHLLNIEGGEDEKSPWFKPSRKGIPWRKDSIGCQSFLHAEQPRKSTPETQV